MPLYGPFATEAEAIAFCATVPGEPCCPGQEPPVFLGGVYSGGTGAYVAFDSVAVPLNYYAGNPYLAEMNAAVATYGDEWNLPGWWGRVNVDCDGVFWRWVFVRCLSAAPDIYELLTLGYFGASRYGLSNGGSLVTCEPFNAVAAYSVAGGSTTLTVTE